MSLASEVKQPELGPLLPWIYHLKGKHDLPAKPCYSRLCSSFSLKCQAKSIPLCMHVCIYLPIFQNPTFHVVHAGSTPSERLSLFICTTATNHWLSLSSTVDSGIWSRAIWNSFSEWYMCLYYFTTILEFLNRGDVKPFCVPQCHTSLYLPRDTRNVNIPCPEEAQQRNPCQQRP